MQHIGPRFDGLERLLDGRRLRDVKRDEMQPLGVVSLQVVKGVGSIGRSACGHHMIAAMEELAYVFESNATVGSRDERVAGRHGQRVNPETLTEYSFRNDGKKYHLPFQRSDAPMRGAGHMERRLCAARPPKRPYTKKAGTAP
jgi:hypothetical protein